MIQEMADLLTMAIEKGASDLHIKAGCSPGLRIHGELMPVEDISPLANDDTERLINSMMLDDHREEFAENGDLDFAHNFSDLHRFRVNVYMQRDSMAAVLRIIPVSIRVFQLGLFRHIEVS